ncbi:sulfotransferase [Nocardioides cheoyonin]|uniref:sulfotransferase n=1 Tax=Nocardioides cheoyonin TaxID=3156615 RepID=UPI0032B4E81D
MPNPDNVDAPVTLVGPGRSGTTLVTQIFRRHSCFFAVGESASLVYTTYKQLNSYLRNTGRIPGDRTVPDAARDAVYAMLCSAYPSEEERWFQKPIFLPTVNRAFETPEEFGSWYWEASCHLFPRGRWLTVVREPVSTAASIMVRWGNTEEHAFRRIENSFRLMLHPASRLGMVMPFEFLQAKPRRAVRALLGFADVPFEQPCMGAFRANQARNPDVPRPTGLVPPRSVMDLYEQLLDRADSAHLAATAD